MRRHFLNKISTWDLNTPSQPHPSPFPFLQIPETKASKQQELRDGQKAKKIGIAKRRGPADQNAWFMQIGEVKITLILSISLTLHSISYAYYVFGVFSLRLILMMPTENFVDIRMRLWYEGNLWLHTSRSSNLVRLCGFMATLSPPLGKRWPA